ncbi:MAG: amidohydrolase, partial [Verrucomicrobia bacterium]
MLLPEMFATGFSMGVGRIREGAERETEAFLGAMAKKLRVFLLGGVVIAETDGKGRNQAVAFSPDGGEIARYSKLQPFTPGGEAEHYAAGKE